MWRYSCLKEGCVRGAQSPGCIFNSTKTGQAGSGELEQCGSPLMQWLLLWFGDLKRASISHPPCPTSQALTLPLGKDRKHFADDAVHLWWEQKGKKKLCSSMSLQNSVSQYQYRPLSSLFLTSPEEGDFSVPVKWYSCQSGQAHEQATFGQAEVQTSHCTSCFKVP